MNVLAFSCKKIRVNPYLMFKTNLSSFSEKDTQKKSTTNPKAKLNNFKQKISQQKKKKIFQNPTDDNNTDLHKISLLKDHSHILHDKSYQNFINDNYNIHSICITNNIVHKYSVELRSNPTYINYVNDWNHRANSNRQKIIDQEKLEFSTISIKQYFLYKPIIDLFVYYLIQNYNKEIQSLRFLSSISDLSKPHLWYPLARRFKRTIYYHCGPTNSGKTSEALKKLAEANTGIYCAPLRLLAWEIQEKLVKMDVKCSLITGQERIVIDNSTHYSCTIEMCSITQKFNVAIIDEIQLIGNDFRGSAWTTALLGLQAEEIHICGDERALKLVHDICEITEDKLIKKSYSRLGDLIVEEDKLNCPTNLRPGDCIIAFSRKEIFRIKEQINSTFRNSENNLPNPVLNRCSVIYGNLPPEIKKVQASAFNERKNGISFLIATDAIGMGLNLKIDRIIFYNIKKFISNKKDYILLSDSEVKQIAGRAGRSDTIGYVSALNMKDLEYIKEIINKSVSKRSNVRNIKEITLLPKQKGVKAYIFNEEEMKIDKACIFLPLDTLKEFSKALENHYNKEKVNIIETLQKFEDLAKIDGMYFPKDLSNIYEIAKYLADIKEADITMQYYFCISPAKVTNLVLQDMKFYLRQLCIVKHVRLPANYHLDNKIFNQKIYKMTDLELFENIHNSLEVYIWLSYKFEVEFIERELARILKDKICKIIDSIIEKQAFDSWKDMKSEAKSEANSGHSGGFTKLLEGSESEKDKKENKVMKFSLLKQRKKNLFSSDDSSPFLK